jgi:hypothetical protein
MNETFLAEARAAGFAVEELKMAGGHTFPMVEQALPAAFDFLERTLAARRQEGAPAGDFTLVRSLAELRPHLSRNGARVRLAPGTYRLDAAESENFLHFTGHDSHFDFTGVRLEVETALLARFRAGTNLLLLSGDRILLERARPGDARRAGPAGRVPRDQPARARGDRARRRAPALRLPSLRLRQFLRHRGGCVHHPAEV